MIAPN